MSKVNWLEKKEIENLVLQEIVWAKRFDSSAFINSLVGLGLPSFISAWKPLRHPVMRRNFLIFLAPYWGERGGG